MKLSIKERINLGPILKSPEGDYAVYQIRSKLRSDLSLSQDEIKAISYREVDTGGGKFISTWNEPKEKKDIDIPDFILKEIIEKLEEIEKDKKLDDNTISIYEKFIIKK